MSTLTLVLDHDVITDDFITIHRLQSEETFYSCAWTVDTTTQHPLLAFAGARGLIRLLNIFTRDCVKVSWRHQ